MAKLKGFRLKRSYFSFPYAVLSALFVILPLLITAFYAFTRNGHFSFDNFVKFFTTPNTLKVLLFSLGMAALVTLICLVLAYPLAMMLADSKINRSAVTVMLFKRLCRGHNRSCLRLLSVHAPAAVQHTVGHG